MKILICVLVIASFVDIFCYRIPNVWIGIGMAAGLVLMTKEGGLPMLAQALLQMSIVFIVCYPFYLLRGLGAGDIKLFMMLGCYIKGTAFLHCLLVAMLLAGAWAVLKMVLYQESRERLIYLGRYCRKVILTGAVDDYVIEKRNRKSGIRVSIPVLCSVLLLYGGFYS